MTPPPSGRDEFIAHEVEVWRTIGSPGFPFDDDRIRRRAAAAFDRSFCPEGVGRQFAAIVASPDRTARLGEVAVPTLVIHGDGDVLVNPSGGRATAAAIAHADLLMIEGMGHDLPVEVWHQVIDAIVKNAGH